MAQSLNPIETVYNGYRFRSRLEARWAVFFDALDVQYRYEPEGYDLDGTWYLPDFWLPDLQCWIEIKGQKPTDEEQKKAGLLAKHSGKVTYIFYDEPWLAKQEASDSAFAFWDTQGLDNCYRWCECARCGAVGITFCGYSERLDCHCGAANTFGETPRLMNAYLAARQARFEHGARS